MMMMMIQQSAPAGQTLVTPRPATLPQRDYRAQPQQTVVRASLAPLPPRQGDYNLHTSVCGQTSGNNRLSRCFVCFVWFRPERDKDTAAAAAAAADPARR